MKKIAKKPIIEREPTELTVELVKTETLFSVKIVDLIALSITGIIYTLCVFEHWFVSFFFLSIPLILILVINVINLVFITKKSLRNNYWLTINNIFRKGFIALSLSCLVVIFFSVIFSDRKITFLFENWNYTFKNLNVWIVNLSIFLSTVFLQLLSLILSLKTILPGENVEKTKKTIHYLILIYYSIMFIFVIYFLIRKILRKGG